MAQLPPSFLSPPEQRRREGDSFFRCSRFGEAVDAYSKAVEIAPNVGEYWECRAECYMRLKEWENCEVNCRRAVELNLKSVKSHYILGIALLEQKKFDSAAMTFEKALEFAKAAGSNALAEDIWDGLAKAKLMGWEQMSSNRIWTAQQLMETCKEALGEQHFLGPSQTEDDHAKQLQLLSDVFVKASEADTPTKVPNHLCCPLSCEILKDPVIAPNGITYERTALLGHFHEEKYFNISIEMTKGQV